MSDYMKVLNDCGLSEKEALLYLSCLQSGASPASSIARLTGLKRPTAYILLQELVTKGLISSYTKGDTVYFSARDPQILVKQAEEKYEHIKSIVPELTHLVNHLDTKPKVEIYEGFEWVKNLYLDTLTSKVKACSFYGDWVVSGELAKWIYDVYVPLRIRNKIDLRVIIWSWSDTSYVSWFAKKDQYKDFTTIKFARDFTLTIKGQIFIYGPDKVFIISYSNGEMMGIILTSHQLYSTFMSLFDYIWSGAEDE